MILFLLTPLLFFKGFGDSYTQFKLIYLLLALGGLLLFSWNKKSPGIFVGKIFLFACGLYLVKVVTNLIFHFSSITILGLIEDAVFPLLVCYFLYFFQSKSELEKISFFKWVYYSGVFCSFGSLISGLLNHFQIPFFTENSFTFGNVNMTAEYISLSFISFFFLFYKKAATKWQVFFLVPIFCSLVLLESRSVWIGLLLTTFFYFYFYNSIGIKSRLVSSGLLLTLIFVGLNHFSFKKDGFKTGSTQNRYQLYTLGWKMAMNEPLGVGLSQFEFNFIPYKALEGNVEHILDKNPHNEILKWTIENGFLYGSLGVLFLFIVFLSLFFKKKDGEVVFLILFFAQLFPQIVFQFPFENSASIVLIACSLALFLNLEIKTILIKFYRPFTILVGIIFITAAVLKFYSTDVVTRFPLDLEKNLNACNVYPLEWRSCTNAIRILDYNKNDEALTNLTVSQLKLRPFNYLALLFLIKADLRTDRIDTACTSNYYLLQFYQKLSAAIAVDEFCKKVEIPMKDVGISTLKESYLRYLDEKIIMRLDKSHSP